jgi:hypothetical protein
MNTLLKVLERSARFIGSRSKRLYIALLARSLSSRSLTLTEGEPRLPDHLKIRTLGMVDFDFRDETCHEIANIAALACLGWWQFEPLPLVRNECMNDRVTHSAGGGLKIEVPPGQSNRWVFLKLPEPVGSGFRLRFEVRLDSEFTEFQIAFNFRHLMDRARFMLVNNRELLFQIVEKGSFIPPLVVRPLKFELGRPYRCEVRVHGSRYAFSVNDRDVIAVDLPGHNAAPGDTMVLILFEEGERREIRAVVEKIELAIVGSE